MSRRSILTLVAGLFALGLVVVIVLFGYILLAGGSGEASVPNAAPTLAASSGTVYSIDPAQSQVRFILTEDLRNVPTTVIGTTNDVAGEIAVDFANPANTKVGTIRINARTLATDSQMRDRAIRSVILQSSNTQFEFIEFTPTGLSGLPGSVATGDTFSFQLSGDLKVRDIVQPVTFDVTATVNSATQLSGSGTTNVTRTQYGLNIPSAPGVANVSENVTLEIDFVATAE